MGNNYYMVIVNNLRFGEEQLEASQIVEALFAERTWLFAQSTPGVESLQSGDKVVICGTSNGKGYFLGSFTLKTSPQPRTHAASSNIVNRLSQLFSLSCEITDEVLWENHKSIVDLLPNFSFLEDKEYYPLYLRQGLRQLSQSDYEQITKAEESAVEQAPSIPNFESSMYDSVLSTAQWLLELINEEIPKRQDAMVDLVQSLHRIPRLEEEFAHLQNLLETQTSNVILLQEENRKQAQRIEELLLSQSDLARREEEARRAYEQELQELRLERGALTEVTGVRKTLQRIFETLQGKRDDSTLSQ